MLLSIVIPAVGTWDTAGKSPLTGLPTITINRLFPAERDITGRITAKVPAPWEMRGVSATLPHNESPPMYSTFSPHPFLAIFYISYSLTKFPLSSLHTGTQNPDKFPAMSRLFSCSAPGTHGRDYSWQHYEWGSYKANLTFGHTLVQFIIVWHLYTENLSCNWANLSVWYWSLLSTIHL